jgi:hypothetical protein
MLLLKPTPRSRYPSVMLYPKPTRHAVHVLMLTAFVGPRPKGQQGMHDDDVPTHNVLGNLSWGTPKQNIAMRKHARGERQGSAKLNVETVLTLRTRAQSEPVKQLAEELGLSFSTAYRAINGTTWSHV